MITLKVVFDNRSYSKGFIAAWGFGCYVAGLDAAILFDTGCDAGILLSNIRLFEIDTSAVELVVISHSHYDHAGGLLGFVRESPGVTLYLPPDSFPHSSTDALRALGAQTLHGENGQQICEGAYLIQTESGGWREQSLVVCGDTESALITGCSHPGILNIVRNVKETLGFVPDVVFGGFHLRGDDRRKWREMAGEFRQLSVQRLGPTHCTGEAATSVFREEFGAEFLEIGVGREICID